MEKGYLDFIHSLTCTHAISHPGRQQDHMARKFSSHSRLKTQRISTRLSSVLEVRIPILNHTLNRIAVRSRLLEVLLAAMWSLDGIAAQVDVRQALSNKFPHTCQEASHARSGFREYPWQCVSSSLQEVSSFI